MVPRRLVEKLGRDYGQVSVLGRRRGKFAQQQAHRQGNRLGLIALIPPCHQALFVLIQPSRISETARPLLSSSPRLASFLLSSTRI